MAKRKAEALSEFSSGVKKVKQQSALTNSSNLLADSDNDASSSVDESEGGAKLAEPEFKINTEFARRFEHNKKREELHRLEEKYQNPEKSFKGRNPDKPYGDKYDEDSEDSEDEDEDDAGFLATEDLDAEISATLQAIRSKDPRVYDEKVTFYKPIEDDDGDEGASGEMKKEKPMYLRDYHRQNLLKGNLEVEDDEAAHTPMTFAQEQAQLQQTLVKEMHAAAEASSEEDEDGGFLVPKSKPKPAINGVHPSRKEHVKVKVDVEIADKDPETFLSNFMAARAWVPTEGARFQPLESDDEEEDERAEKFEAAYNLRFEDPSGSNEMLKSYARDVVAAKSVRREEPSGRKKQRDTLRERREAERKEAEEERAQLRRLKVEEMEQKLKMIKKAAGIRGKSLKQEELMKFLDEGWDDVTWIEQMNKYFGEDYYAEKEDGSEEDSDVEVGDSATEKKKKKKKKLKKPKWDDDIDIKDIIPEFVEEEEAATEKGIFTLSESDADSEEIYDDDNSASNPKKTSSKDRQALRQAKKKASRLERKRIEDLVDSHLDPDIPSKGPSRFRYRETSPTSFGLTPRDILLASDQDLNQFAGLKKMATYRDAEKKRKDKKFLGKKARLRMWRRETFGNEEGPDESAFAAAVGGGEDVVIGGSEGEGGDIVEGKRRKKKRSRKAKVAAVI